MKKISLLSTITLSSLLLASCTTVKSQMKKKPSDTSKYREAALKRWANPDDRKKRIESFKKGWVQKNQGVT